MRRVVGPLLSGGEERDFSARDIEYVRDLGLVASGSPLRIGNPIYAEVVPRELRRRPKPDEFVRTLSPEPFHGATLAKCSACSTYGRSF